MDNESEENQVQQTSKEIIINLNSKEDNKSDVEDTPLNDESPNISSEDTPKTDTSSNNFVAKKNLRDLSEDEKNIIISNARKGIDQPFYDIKDLKNGKTIITRKKKTTPSTAQKVISSSSSSKKKSTTSSNNEIQKAYYTDNQLLFEHIIELNSKVDKLMNKHKKLKRRYQTLQNDLYIEDDDVSSPPNDESPNESPNESPSTSNTEYSVSPNVIRTHMQPMSRSNWRSRLTYL